MTILYKRYPSWFGLQAVAGMPQYYKKVSRFWFSDVRRSLPV